MIKPLVLQVRFVDIDSFGHVNNAVYLSYFEMARMHYLEKYLGRDWDYISNGFLLARNEIDYIRPIFLADQPEISMGVEHIGNRSFTFNYEIKVGEEVVTKGKSVLVAYNTKEMKAIPIPEKLLETLKKWNRSNVE